MGGLVVGRGGGIDALGGGNRGHVAFQELFLNYYVNCCDFYTNLAV